MPAPQARSPVVLCCALAAVQHELNSSAKTGVGTPIYMAPEIIYGGNKYDAKASGAVLSHV